MKKRKALPPAAAPSPPVRLRVLVCDDQKLIRALICEMLRASGSIEVAGEAANGSQAVTLALELAPDVILMDVSMPVVDGVEATRQILSASPGARVLAFSVDSSPETVKKMIAAGARGYLVKTGDLVELVPSLHKVAAGKRLFGSPRNPPATRPGRD